MTCVRSMLERDLESRHRSVHTIFKSASRSHRFVSCYAHLVPSLPRCTDAMTYVVATSRSTKSPHGHWFPLRHSSSCRLTLGAGKRGILSALFRAFPVSFVHDPSGDERVTFFTGLHAVVLQACCNVVSCGTNQEIPVRTYCIA